MRNAKIKNKKGETIEIKFNDDGVIEIRHSAINPKEWGQLREYSKVMKQPGLQGHMAEKGVKETNDPDIKELFEKLGGYIVLPDRQSYIINQKDVDAIHQAVKQAGGIVPNMSSGGI